MGVYGVTSGLMHRLTLNGFSDLTAHLVLLRIGMKTTRLRCCLQARQATKGIPGSGVQGMCKAIVVSELLARLSCQQSKHRPTLLERRCCLRERAKADHLSIRILDCVNIYLDVLLQRLPPASIAAYPTSDAMLTKPQRPKRTSWLKLKA